MKVNIVNAIGFSNHGWVTTGEKMIEGGLWASLGGLAMVALGFVVIKGSKTWICADTNEQTQTLITELYNAFKATN